MKTKSGWEDEYQMSSHLSFGNPGGKHPIGIVEEKHHWLGGVTGESDLWDGG